MIRMIFGTQNDYTGLLMRLVLGRGLGECGKSLASFFRTDGLFGFVEVITVVEYVDDADASFGAAFGEGVVAGPLEVVIAFFPLDTAPAQVHSDELKAAIADQVKVFGVFAQKFITDVTTGDKDFTLPLSSLNGLFNKILGGFFHHAFHH